MGDDRVTISRPSSRERAKARKCPPTGRAGNPAKNNTMSAYLCDKNHILFLVHAATTRALLQGSAAQRWRHAGQWHELAPGDFTRAAEVAQMLFGENLASVSHRYPGESSADLPGPIREDWQFTARDFAKIWPVSPVQVLNSLRCYEYQSCEHESWTDSEARAFCEALRQDAINALPGMEAAEWGAPQPQHGVQMLIGPRRRAL
jgi:hypothetical protein